ncbi:unnamed protein product [Arabidopsis arenosa]|uniref:Uncharacterized protein n=1 Tax=Arabidopsis arenosa TaxID=38785 RepID=A0A8S2AF60_ARAAE|nr:unnamed protein product [Arabidopsis arenosa]
MEHERLGASYPGMWRLPTNPRRCCIYRVPTSLREISNEAYTPRLVLIGPLHHALKAESRRSLRNTLDAKSIDYLNTEEIKKLYLSEFSGMLPRLGKTIDQFIKTIQQQEQAIRDSYSESTSWINSREFCDMILSDAVFILMFSWKCSLDLTARKGKTVAKRSGDPLLDVPCLEYTIKRDLLLLENQLPFYILHMLFHAIVPALFPDYSFHELVMLLFFSHQKRVLHAQTFLHFTDLMRGVHVFSLPERDLTKQQAIKSMPCADQLRSMGVKFQAVKEDFSINVRLENGCLKIPTLCVDDHFEATLRNLAALEQCYYPHAPHVCNYLAFIDFLIDTDKDTELLAKKGIITGMLGKPSLVAEMVTKLGRGIYVDTPSCYSGIANRLNAYYNNRINKSCSLIRTVCSIIQVKPK